MLNLSKSGQQNKPAFIGWIANNVNHPEIFTDVHYKRWKIDYKIVITSIDCKNHSNLLNEFNSSNVPLNIGTAET